MIVPPPIVRFSLRSENLPKSTPYTFDENWSNDPKKNRVQISKIGGEV